MIDKIKLNMYAKDKSELDDAKAKLKELRMEFDEQNKDLVSTIKGLEENLCCYKDDLTKEAIDEYNELQVKKLTGGIGIRIGTVLEYDPDLALSWAMEHGLCLALDKKSFETIAKTQSLNFVNYDEKITVTFPKDIKLEESN